MVPVSLRQEVLERLHEAHMGIEASLGKARESVFWPGLTAQLKDKIQRCEVCQSLGMCQPKEPLKSHDIPSRPWEVLGADLFEFGGGQLSCDCGLLQWFLGIG